MSVIFISGKPGGGKSYWAFKQYVVRELIQGHRTIITNLDILPGMLNEWLQEFAPKQVRQMDIDLHSRLIILTKDQSNRFYLYRPEDYRLKDPEEEWDADKFSGKVKQHGYKRPKLDLTQCYRGTAEEEETCNPRELGGVLYIIDELHEYFNAREWMETGRSALTYLSQHRKMGDDVICITQSIGNVDKQFRSVAQEFQYVRNYNKEKVGAFKSFPWFEVKYYLTPADNAGSKAFNQTTFRLDSRLKYCYDTAAGVGVAGGLADMGQKVKGIPIWVLGLLILCGIVGLVFAPSMVSNLIAGSASDALAPMTSRPTPPVPPGATNELANSQSTFDQANPEAPASAVQIRRGLNHQAGSTAASGNASKPSSTPTRKLVGITVVGGRRSRLLR